MLFEDLTIGTEAPLLFDLQPGFANCAEQTRHLRVFHFLPFAGKAGTLPADAVTNIMQTHMDFLHDRPSFLSWSDDCHKKLPGTPWRQTITAGHAIEYYQSGAVGKLVFVYNRVKENWHLEITLAMTNFIDISVPVYQGMPVFPGDYGAEIKPYRQIAKGDSAKLSEIHLGHIPAPILDRP